MMFKGVGKKAIAVLTAGLFFAVLIFYNPNPASATPYLPLGTSASYSLVSSGALVLGATTQYSGDAPVKGACPTCTETMVTDIFARGLTLLRNSDTATAAVTAVSSARTLLIGLTKTQTIDATTAITVLSPGVYETTSNAALGVTTSFTLDGGGNLDSVFVFRTTAEINFTASIEILLTNGAQASNVYWVAGTAITTGASSKIPGNLIAAAAITTGDSTIVRGSILGLGAVTLGASTSIIHYAAITPPTSLIATAGDSQTSLTWSAPTYTGGSILSDYLIQYSNDGTTYSTFSHTASTAISSTVTGLTNGTTYTFKVSTITASGTGPASSTSSATPRTIPSAPLNPVAMPGVSQATLSWNVPASNGGSAITGYTVTSSPLVTAPAGCTNTPNLSCTFTGLLNGTSYSFTAVAINIAGPSTASVSVSATPAALTAEQIEAARLAALEADRLAGIAAENARIAAANAEAARLAAIARSAAIAAENARIEAATAELARLAEIARAAAVEAARLAAIEAERARLAEIARLAELERIANCKSTISNIQYASAAPGSSFGHLSWTTTGNGVFQYFGDTFLYPAFMQYGIYSAEWKGYLINLVPGVRYQVSVNYLSDCGQISGVSMTIMNEKEVALVVPTPTPSPIPTPAPSLIIQIPIPVVTKTPAPIELVRPIKTKTPAPVVTVAAMDYKTVTMKPAGQSTVHVALHNLVLGQKVIITLRTVEP